MVVVVVTGQVGRRVATIVWHGICTVVQEQLRQPFVTSESPSRALDSNPKPQITPKALQTQNP